MRRITETLHGLSEAERTRVLAYVNHRASDPPQPPPPQPAQTRLIQPTSQEQPALL